MKKTMLLKILLVIFPILAVGLATTTDSVTVFNTVTGQTQYHSYFDILPVENLQMIPPLTALLSGLSGILAAVYMAKGGKSLLKTVGYAALGSVFLAAVPYLYRGDSLVIPNVALPIFMALEFIVTLLLDKAPEQTLKKNHSPRLSRR